MPQLVARAVPGTLLFRTNEEARALWNRLVSMFPEALSLCLMPNHVHLDLPHEDPSGNLSVVMRAYALWRNHHRGARGAVWEPRPEVRTPEDGDHARRLRRYTLLNPCRGKLTTDPLTWAWASHRDLLGLARTPLIERVRDDEYHHSWVSSDYSTDTGGTALPRTHWGYTDWGMVVDAVCAVTRTFAYEVQNRGPARTLAVKTAWAHGLRDVAQLAAAVGLLRRAVNDIVEGVPARGADFADPVLAACVRVVGDSRFSALATGDLRRTEQWMRSKYRGLK